MKTDKSKLEAPNKHLDIPADIGSLIEKYQKVRTKMSKIILEFDGIEEKEDARTALDGYKWKMAMWDLDQLLRSTTKYDVSLLKHNEQASEAEYEIAEKIREEIGRILGDYNLCLD